MYINERINIRFCVINYYCIDASLKGRSCDLKGLLIVIQFLSIENKDFVWNAYIRLRTPKSLFLRTKADRVE